MSCDPVPFAAGLRWRYVAGAAGAAIVLLPVLIVMAPYRLQRMLAFLHPEQDIRGPNFQLMQSKIAIGSGGVTGSGLALGQQKWLFLPESHTDFIFSSWERSSASWGSADPGLSSLLCAESARAFARRTDSALISRSDHLVRVSGFSTWPSRRACCHQRTAPPLRVLRGSSLIVSLAMAGVLLNVSQQAG